MNRNKPLQQKKSKLRPGGAPVNLTELKIDVRPFHRTSQDIASWRAALQSAESRIPRRVLLYDLYADVDLDGHVESVTDKRRVAVSSANWKFVNKKGEEIDAINEMIDTIGFEDLLNEIINSKFWGYKILEPTIYKNFNGQWEISLYSVPMLNIRPQLGVIAKDAYTDEGIQVRKGIYAKTIMEVGKPDDLGLFIKAAPYQILKRGGLGDWAMFVQVFGNPLIDATWNGFDEKQRVALLQALSELGQGGAIVRPEGTNVQLIDKQSNANGDLQRKFTSFLNKEISKVLLGSTETTESSDSSGQTQAQIHAEQDERKHESDITFARRILNSRLIPIMNAFGINTEGGRFIVAGEEDSLTKKEMYTIHEGLITKMGLPVDDDFLYDTYDIPKPKDYEAQKAAKEAAKAAIQETDPDSENFPKKPPKKGEKPKPKEEPKEEQVSLSLLHKLKSFFLPALMPKGTRANPKNETVKCCGDHLIIKLTEAQGYDNDGLISKAFAAKGKLDFNTDLFEHTANLLLKGFKKGWATGYKVELADLGFEYGIDNPELIKAFETNIFRFSAGKTQAQILMLNELFKQATSFEQFYELAIAQLEVFNRHWMETEYNTAILIGESSATYQRLMAQVDIFPYWEYRTVRDEQVRDSHAALDGVILRWDDPRWAKLFPPNGWNCRCYIVPRLEAEFEASELFANQAKVDAFLESPEFEKIGKQGFGFNRGETAEVFAENQQYLERLPNTVMKIVREVQERRDQ